MRELFVICPGVECERRAKLGFQLLGAIGVACQGAADAARVPKLRTIIYNMHKPYEEVNEALDELDRIYRARRRARPA